MMAKIELVSNSPDLKLFLCPGCKYPHSFDKRWTWNDSTESPTVSPSILVWQSKPEKRCHSFITDGEIRFLEDSWHDLKGQTVELPEFNYGSDD
jgi:hypothetical protein